MTVTKKCTNLICPSASKESSSIRTKLFGTGRARLSFGNCYRFKKGKVKVLLDGQEIAFAARMERKKVIEFNFNHDSTLEIVGETRGVTQVNDMKILSCQSNVGKNNLCLDET